MWGISPQGLDSHEAFARGASLTFPLLSETAGTVIRDHGVNALAIGVRRSEVELLVD